MVIDLQLWINEGTANSGLTEVAALQDLLGPPESILYSRYLGQSIYFAYPTRGLLVAFLLPLGDTPEVCLAEEIGPFTIVDFHDPATRPGLTRQRTEIPPINWPSAINLTVDALWEALQDGSSCVPGAY